MDEGTDEKRTKRGRRGGKRKVKRKGRRIGRRGGRIVVWDILKFLNLKGHQNCMTGSKVTTISMTKSDFLHTYFLGST